MVSPLPSEPKVLKRCAEGDAEQFGKLVTHYQDAIFNLVFRMIGNREDARDLTQEVFIKAFRRIKSFEGRSSFGTWLYSIAVNQAISERRRRSAASRGGRIHMSRLDGDETQGRYDPPGNGPAPDERLRADETRQRIEQAIAELADDYRAVVLLREVEGLDYDSIGDVLGCSRGTVKSRLHRARQELRRKLQGLLIA